MHLTEHSPMLEWALYYASLGCAVLPLHTMRNGHCSCSTQANCKAAAKHPVNQTGLSAATTDEATIRAWWAKMPDANIGIHARRSNWLIFDVDIYHNDLEKLENLSEILGPLPDTATHMSGSGEGYHLPYVHPGFDTRGVLGAVVRSEAFIVAAPSLHRSGRRYAWEPGLAPWEYAVAELPDTWKEALRKTASVGTVGVPDADDEPEWLAEVPAEQRVEDMRAHLEREPGETKGESLPGTTFNVARTAARKYAVRDPEAVLLAMQEIYDPKCKPPWNERLGRHVWSAYERATNPAWGEHYYPETERMGDLGFDVETPVAKKPEKKISHEELAAALKTAKEKLGRATNANKKLQATYLSRVLKGEPLTARAEDMVDALKVALRAMAEHTPTGTPDLAIAEIMIRSCPPTLTTEQLLGMVAKYRKAVPPKDAAQQGALPPPKDDDELRGQMIGGREEGTVKVCGPNIARILRYSKDLKGHIHFNELTKDIEVWDGIFAETAKGVLDIDIANWLGEKWQLFCESEPVGKQLSLVARKGNNYNPVEEYLRALKWDGVPRIDTWLHYYCGAEDTVYNQRVGSMWMISACARGIDPGCKVDSVLVLEGEQGAKKSTAFAILGGEWFSGTPLVLGDKDSYMVASSTWIIELAELSSLRAGEVEAHKAFLTSAEDRFRPPYGKVTESFRRYCVFCGTTNEHEYLQDSTGNRRYWACRVADIINTAKLREDRDQLWAEATFRYLSASLNPHLADSDAPGERWWFTPAEAHVAAEVVAKRKIDSPWVGMILDWYGKQSRPGPGATRPRVKFTLADVAKGALEMDPTNTNRQNKTIMRALREAGFEQSDDNGNGQKFWVKKGTVVHDIQAVAPEPQPETPEPPGSN